MKWQLSNWLEGRFNPAVFRVWQKHIALQNFWVQQNLKPILTTGYFPPSCLSQFLKENLNLSVASYLHSTHQHVVFCFVFCFQKMFADIQKSFKEHLFIHLLQAPRLAKHQANRHHNLEIKGIHFSSKPRKQF